MLFTVSFFVLKQLTAHQQRLEGDFRVRHSRLIAHSEEVAFLRGSKRERKIINSIFDRLYAHAGTIFKKQALVSSTLSCNSFRIDSAPLTTQIFLYCLFALLCNAVMDEFLVKYGATMVGYTVVAFPVFGGTYKSRLAGATFLMFHEPSEL